MDNSIQAHQKELCNKLWAMANALRGNMEAYEFKNYILGMIFYYYLSDRTEKYMANLLKDDGISYEDAWADEEYKEAVVEEALRDLGFIIEPQFLFRKMVKMVENRSFDIEFLQKAINALMESTLGNDSQEDFDGLFSDMQLDSTKLGHTVKDRSAVMAKIIASLDEINFGVEDTKIDVLGNAYEYLIGQFAATAGKKAGEFYTPSGPAELLCRLACLGLTDVKDAADPCSGSGHILVYAFDVLMDIYLSQGYTEREAAQSILAHNLYGLDIDDRAYQLTYFALMMKARQYDRRIFTRELRPQVYAVEESNGMEKWEGEIPQTQALDLSETYRDTADYLIDTFRDAKEYGSLITVEPRDYAGLAAEIERLQQEGTDDLLLAGWLYTDGNRLIRLARQAQVMSSSFWVSSTNPPYMASGNMSPLLSAFAKKNYPVSKADLFAMFMERCGAFTREKGFQAMITQHSWMFLSSFEALRKKLQQKTLVDMAHLGPRAFEEIGGEVVQVTSFVLANCQVPGYQGTYCRLLEPTTQDGKEKMFLEGKNRYTAKQENFAKIPGEPVAYWVSRKVFSLFNAPECSNYYIPKFGMSCGDGLKYIRLWYEVDCNLISFNYKSENDFLNSPKYWNILDKGGTFRKWYGNKYAVIFWKNNGNEIKQNPKSVVRNPQYFFKPHISWTLVSSGSPSFRYFESGFILDTASNALYLDKLKFEYGIGLLNSKIAIKLLNLLNPTINLSCGVVGSIPFLFKQEYKKDIKENVDECISLSKADWDSFETSWDFQGHPLVQRGMSDLMSIMLGESAGATLEDRYLDFQAACEDRFIILQENEEKLNRIFIDIYDLQDELTPEVADKDITVHKVFDRKEDVPASMAGSNYVLTKEDVMKSLLSYAVGCLFGRYSLDTPGLAYAGGEWDAGKYKTFIPDDDNVLPITDEEYFDDDLPAFICGWLKKAFGRENFEANLEFLTDALETRGATPKEKLRNYFLKDFYKDHCRTYQKRPIYWLFDSGKENGFKAFVYIHRWDQDTEGRVMLYLHKVQRKYETELRMLEQELNSVKDKHRIGQLEKRREHLEKQLAEVKAYDEKLDHMASEHLAMDLDDGVKVNYEKMQTDREGIKYPILAKIK